HVLDRLARRLAVVDHQAHGDAQRRAVAHAALAALALVEHRLAELVADVFQRRVAVVADDREHRLERGVQALVGALRRIRVGLQEFPVGIDLDGEQERHFEDRASLAEVLADALLLGERIVRLVRGCRHGELPPRGICGPRVRGPGGTGMAGSGKSPVGSRWYCRHQHAFSRYFRLSTRVSFQVLQQRPKAGGFRPQPRLVALTAGDARTAYFTSTVAPAASRSFLNLSASSFDTPSLTAPPASVRSLASFRPRPVIARTT